MKDWFTAEELAGQPQVPTTSRRVRELAKRKGWQLRNRKGRGGGNEYHLSSLPAETQAALLKKQAAPQVKRSPKSSQTVDTESLWMRYDRAPESMKEQAHRRVEALTVYQSLIDNGVTKSQAANTVADQYDANRATVYRWLEKVKALPRPDWPAALVSGHTGRFKGADFTEAAWNFFRADYLRLEAPTVAACYHRLQRAANEHGWQIPAIRTVER